MISTPVCIRDHCESVVLVAPEDERRVQTSANVRKEVLETAPVAVLGLAEVFGEGGCSRDGCL